MPFNKYANVQITVGALASGGMCCAEITNDSRVFMGANNGVVFALDFEVRLISRVNEILISNAENYTI